MGCGRSALAVLVTTPNAAVRRQISAFIHITGRAALEATDERQARKIANEYQGDIHVCLVEGGPESALAILGPTRKRHPSMTALVISAHPESIVAKTTADAAVAFIEKPFSWRVLDYRLAERVYTSLRARHQSLVQQSAELVDDCVRICADISATRSSIHFSARSEQRGARKP